jgi:hypothetical protein
MEVCRYHRLQALAGHMQHFSCLYLCLEDSHPISQAAWLTLHCADLAIALQFELDPAGSGIHVPAGQDVACRSGGRLEVSLCLQTYAV